MEFHFLPIFTFLSLALVASHATQTPQAYWKSVLPNTPMPKALMDLLPPEWIDKKSTSVTIGKSGVNVDRAGEDRTRLRAGEDRTRLIGNSGVNVDRAGEDRTRLRAGEDRTRLIGKSGVNVDRAGEDRTRLTLIYGTAFNSTKDQVLHDNRNIAFYFLENDIKPGMKMNLCFTKSTNPATFLPRQVAESIPFTSNKMQQILNHFSVKPNSVEAEIMKTTIKICEEPAIKGEEKYCATSMESMIDFTTSNLRNTNVQAITTVVEKETRVQKYRIAGAKKMVGENAVVCHKQNYAYAVFYCHKLQKTKAYMVSLVGADGTKAKAVAVCYTDTSQWNPNHLAFQLLNLKPGKTVPICHYFLQEDQIVWFAP